MKNLILLVIILFLGAGLPIKTFAQEKSGDDKKEKTEQMNENKAASDDQAELNTICPVSKEEADPEITYEYKGKTYALCCNNCLKKFKKDPEKYISRLNEDGKTDKKPE